MLWSPTVVSTKAEKAEKGFKTIYYTCYANSRECYGGFIQKSQNDKTKRRHTTMIFLFFFFFSQKNVPSFLSRTRRPSLHTDVKSQFCPKIEICLKLNFQRFFLDFDLIFFFVKIQFLDRKRTFGAVCANISHNYKNQANYIFVSLSQSTLLQIH